MRYWYCSGVISSASSFVRGQLNAPSSSLLYKSRKPSPSQTSPLIRSVRLPQNRNRISFWYGSSWKLKHWIWRTDHSASSQSIQYRDFKYSTSWEYTLFSGAGYWWNDKYWRYSKKCGVSVKWFYHQCSTSEWKISARKSISDRWNC